MTDLEILARTVFGEAEGESFAGKLAVAWSVQNRVDAKSWYGATIAGVCHKPMQYSCWNEGARRPRVLSVTLDEPAFRDSVAAAAAVICALAPDPTEGATHYLTRAAYERHQAVGPRSPATWSYGLKPCAEIGGHLFFNDVP